MPPHPRRSPPGSRVQDVQLLIRLVVGVNGTLLWCSITVSISGHAGVQHDIARSWYQECGAHINNDTGNGGPYFFYFRLVCLHFSKNDQENDYTTLSMTLFMPRG